MKTAWQELESNPGQGQVKYECVVACTRPQTNTVTSGYSVTKQNAAVLFKE